MSKSITQDMRYRQSLMQYAEKYGVSRASRKYNKSRSYIYFWKTCGTAVWNPWPLPVPASSQSPKPAHRGRTEAHPGYAKAESNTGNGGTLAPASQTRVYPPSGKPVPDYAQAGNVPTAQEQSGLQGKTIRTDAVSRTARAGGCESGTTEMSGKSG